MAYRFQAKSSHLKGNKFLLLSFFAACLLGIAADRASAQANYAASRHPSHLSVFGEASQLRPDYGTQKNYGYTFGADYTLHYRILNPSLEFRVNRADGQNVAQTSYMGGLKGSKDYGRLHPYGDFLIGYGKITFNHPHGQYFRDNSTVFGAGGGVDVDVIGNFGAKAEFQYQSWKLGSANNRLTPTLLSIGLVYHLPF